MKRQPPVHLLIEMIDESNNTFLVAPGEEGMVTIYPSGNSDMKVTLDFEGFCGFISKHHINFRDEEDGTMLPAFTDLNQIMNDLKGETSPTKIYHLEQREIYWHIPQRKIFASAEKGIIDPADMPEGKYIYELFSNNAVTDEISDTAMDFWRGMLNSEDPASFIEQTGISREKYEQHESVFGQIPHVRTSFVKMYPFFREEWLTAYLIYMLN